MITAAAHQHANGTVSLQLIYPGETKKQPQIILADNMDDAVRIVYFRNRKFISETLIKWLHQREHALLPFPKSRNYYERLAEIKLLQVKLNNWQNGSFHKVCQVVSRTQRR